MVIQSSQKLSEKKYLLSDFFHMLNKLNGRNSNQKVEKGESRKLQLNYYSQDWKTNRPYVNNNHNIL